MPFLPNSFGNQTSQSPLLVSTKYKTSGPFFVTDVTNFIFDTDGRWVVQFGVSDAVFISYLKVAILEGGGKGPHEYPRGVKNDQKLFFEFLEIVLWNQNLRVLNHSCFFFCSTQTSNCPASSLSLQLQYQASSLRSPA